MAKKNVIVSQSGLTTCPSCMSHITLGVDLAQTECPFCHTNLVAERRQDDGVFGRNTLQALKRSKSAMLAAALGASLSMAACGGDDNNDDDNTSMDQGVDMTDETPKDMPPSLDAAYGGPPIDPEKDMAPMMDMEPSRDLGEPVAMYGAPPIDFGLEEDMG